MEVIALLEYIMQVDGMAPKKTTIFRIRSRLSTPLLSSSMISGSGNGQESPAEMFVGCGISWREGYYMLSSHFDWYASQPFGMCATLNDWFTDYVNIKYMELWA